MPFESIWFRRKVQTVSGLVAQGYTLTAYPSQQVYRQGLEYPCVIKQQAVVITEASARDCTEVYNLWLETASEVAVVVGHGVHLSL